MLWRVGRGNRQSLHQLVHSLADLFIPSSHTSRPYPSVPLTCLRSFVLSRRRVRPALTSHDHDDPNTTVSPSPNPVQFNTHRSVAPPIHDVPSGHPKFMESSHIRSAVSRSLRKKITKLLADPDLHCSFSDSRKVSRLAQQMISTPRPRRALLVLAAAHYYGCHLGREVYETVAWRLAKAREWRSIPALARLQKRQSGRQTARLLDWCIRARVEMSQFARLDRALKWFEEEGLLPSRRTYLLLLTGHLRNRNIVKAMDVIQRMLKAGFGIDARTHATVISAYRTLGPDVVVQTCALNTLKDADANTATRILNALLQFSIDTRDTENVLSLICHFDFGTFDVSQLPFGVRPLRREGEDATLSDLIRSSSANHPVLPDIATYTILLHYMASQGDLVSTHGLLGQMKHSGVTPDSRFIAALIRLYFAIGQPSAAVNVVSEVCVGVEGFRTEFRNIPLATESQEELPLPHVLPKPTVEIFNALAAGLLHSRGIDGLQACLRLMQLCQVDPDRHTQALLASHLINAGFTMVDVARVSKELSLNDLSLSRLSHSLAFSLRRHFRSVKRSGWNNTPGKHTLFPTRSPSHPAPTSTAQGKSFDPAVDIQLVITRQNSCIQPIIRSLADGGVLADHRMFALRIRFEAVINGDMRAAKSIFQLMLDRGLHPNEYHYAALMEGYAATGELAGAEAVMIAAERGGIKPNCVMHTILIVGYARQKNPQRAMRVLRHMIATGVRPDVPAVDAITSVFFATGTYRLARQTLLSLWPSVVPLPPNFEWASLKMLVFHLRKVYDGQTSSKKLSQRERRKLIGKLKELSSTWFLTEKPRTDPRRKT